MWRNIIIYMLIKKNFLIKIPYNCSLKYLVCFKTKYLILTVNTCQKDVYFVLIPKNIRITKKGFFISVVNQGNNIKVFLNYFQNLLNNFRLKSFKQLLLLGLGLKILLENSVFLMRLGFSHNNSVSNIYKYINECIITKIGLKGFLITFYGFNKIKLGNLVEKIYKLRPADCYKHRGFSYKNKFNLLKIVKKK